MTSPYTAVTVEGGLLSADLIERIRSADRDLPGNRPEDYHLAAGERLGEAASRKWEYLKGAYAAFRDRIAALPENDPATTETRERWLLRLFDELGYGRLTYLRGGITVGEKTYPISHRWGEHVAVHLLGWHADLDRRTGHRGESARAPQSMVQEFLNGSDAHLWGVLSNGRLLRIVRDSKTLVSSAYVQFDLEAIFDGDLYPEFVQLFAMLHSSRLELLPREDGGEPTVADCWLERWRDHAIETGSRAREQLRKNVEKALNELGTGFLEANSPLREELTSGRLTRHDFHHELLRLAYQLIFLFVAEGRGALLLPDPPDATPDQRAELNAARDRYTKYFSVERLRRIASRRRGDRHPDLWRTLVVVLDALGSDEGRPELALPALGGLFFRAGDPLADGAADGPAPDLLRACELTNERLLSAIRLLTTFKDKKGRLNRVDYRHLDAEELGSVYESLLELEPRPDCAEAVFRLEELPGNQRKTTGSYYTPTALIDELLKTTLDPVIDEYARDRNPDDLLKITVCDPACGSGHFLVAAARRIARRYAALWNDEEEPTPATIRDAMHKVVGQCVYGVDLNPMAAELAKVSLWLESLQPGRPLAFLDSHIKVGNSLLGTTPKLLLQGIPDEAYKAIGDDDKKVITDIRKQNAKERGRQLSFHDEGLFDMGEPEAEDTAVLTRQATALNSMRITSVADIREQARRFRALLGSPDLAQRKRIADAWCAAFVFPKQREPRPITTATLNIMGGDETARNDFPQAAPTEDMERELAEITKRYQFFHWHLEFPDVFRVGDDGARDANPDTGWQGGFSCVLGNPPWERVKLQEQEFFASRNDQIAKAANAAARKKLINALKDSDEPTDRSLYADFQAELRQSTGWSQMLRSTGRYPLTGRGDVNTYSVFAETGRTIIAPRGRSGLVLPTGIATDATTAPFFSDLVSNSKLVSFLEFENEEFLLSKDVDHRVRFCLLSTAGREVSIEEADFSFGARQISDIENRRFTMPPEDILLLNPNTGTAPLFRSRRDAKITLEIYRHVPVLWKKTPRSNPWGVSFMAMFHMANDSAAFARREDLEREGWRLEGNIFTKADRYMLPLYESKMMHHFDHRLGTYDGQSEAQAKMGTLPRLNGGQKKDPAVSVMPRYWIPEEDIDERLDSRWSKDWLIGFRKICRATDERTLVTAILPKSGFGDSGNLVFPSVSHPHLLYAAATSFVADYVLRQKMAGTNLNFFQFEQIAFPVPDVYFEVAAWDRFSRLGDWISRRLLELVYTSWDISSFAGEFKDAGGPFVWDEERRFAMRAELDAAYFHLYGVKRDDVGFIMDSFGAFRRNDPERFERTKSLILDVYDAMAKAIETGAPYKAILNPPPGQGPRHPER